MKQLVSRILSYAGYEITKSPKKNDTDLYVELFGEISVKNRRFYNICAGGHWGFGGGFHHPCWTNVDLLRKKDENYN